MKRVRKLKHLRPEPGLQIGRITLISSRRDEKGRKLWKYQCDCGSDPKEAGDNNVRMGSPQSCGDCPTSRGPAPRRPDAAPAQTQRQEGRPPAESRMPWRPYSVQRPPAPPAQRATGDNVTYGPSYTHDPRFQLPEGTKVVGGFASMGIGRYLDGGRA